MQRIRVFILTSVLSLLAAGPSLAQDVSPMNGSAGLRVYIDCDGRHTCDRDFIRTELDYIDHVREPLATDVHVLITTQRTGSGGTSFNIAFLGRRAFAAVSDTLTYSSLGSDTDDERRRGLTNTIAAGLVPFLVRTPLGRRLRIGFDRNGSTAEERAIDTVDPWKNWVFNLGVSGSFDGEASRTSFRSRGNVSANRTTEDWKVRLSTRGDYSEAHFELEDTTIVNTQRSGNAFAFVAASLGPHLSAGFTSSASTSTRNNTNWALQSGAAIEYNIFPYTEATRRELRIQYGVDVRRVKYDEETVYNETLETLMSHGLEVRLDLDQPWGGASSGIEFTHFLTNFDRSLTSFYSIEIEGRINVRIVRGLSVHFGGGVDFIHDQLYLRLSDASDEDVLLGRIRLPTTWEVSLNAGINFSFGSIFNNAVNPRFGGF